MADKALASALRELLKEQMHYDWLLLDAEGVECIRTDTELGQKEHDRLVGIVGRVYDLFEQQQKETEAIYTKAAFTAIQLEQMKHRKVVEEICKQALKILGIPDISALTAAEKADLTSKARRQIMSHNEPDEKA